MSAQFLLFVIAILLFAIFWETCKINSRLKKALSAAPSPVERAKSMETAEP